MGQLSTALQAAQLAQTLGQIGGMALGGQGQPQQGAPMTNTPVVGQGQQPGANIVNPLRYTSPLSSSLSGGILGNGRLLDNLLRGT